MNEAIVGITIAYIVLAVLTVFFITYTHWPTWLKAGIVVLTSVFYYVTYASFENILGWPTNSHLPKEFMMLSGYVTEPNEAAGEKGRVFLWLMAYDHKNKKVLDEPRAYRLPYSKYMHEQVNTADKKTRRNITQVGRVDLVSSPKLKAPKTWADERIERITIFDFPHPELPEK